MRVHGARRPGLERMRKGKPQGSPWEAMGGCRGYRRGCQATGAVREQRKACVGIGEGVPPPPLQGAQPTRSHCPPDANRQLQRHL